MITNFVDIQQQIECLKGKCLAQYMNLDYIKIFSIKVSRILESGVADFIEETGDKYAAQILDINKKNDFEDFSSGYKGQMYAWFKENPIITQKITINDLDKTNDFEKQKTLQSAALSTAAIVVVYFISGSVIITLAAGVLGLIWTLYQKKIGHQKDIKTYEDKLQEKMEELVKAIAKEAYDWLDKLEAQSDKVLASFGLNFFDK